MFECYVVEDVMINVVIQGRPVIIKFNLIFCLISSLMITQWLIVDELEKLSNHTLKDSEMMIFIKDWVLNYCFLWNNIILSLQSFHTFLFNLFQFSINLVCFFDLFIEIVLARGALLCTLPLFQGGDLKLFQW